MLRKQATDTKTCLYIMTKFPLAMYHDYSTRDSCSIKLHNRKIWHNIYRTEFIIRQAVPLIGATFHGIDSAKSAEFPGRLLHLHLYNREPDVRLSAIRKPSRKVSYQR